MVREDDQTSRPKEGDKLMTEKIPRRIIQTDKSADLPLFAKAAATNLRDFVIEYYSLSTTLNLTERTNDTRLPFTKWAVHQQAYCPPDAILDKCFWRIIPLWFYCMPAAKSPISIHTYVKTC